MLWRVDLVLKRAYVLMAGRVTDVGFLQRAGTHDHGHAQLARPGGLEAYCCASRRSVGGEVPKVHCSSELGRVRLRHSSVSLSEIRVSPVAAWCCKLWM